MRILIYIMVVIRKTTSAETSLMESNILFAIKDQQVILPQ